MPNADAAWLRMDAPVNLMVINAVLLLDEPLDRDRLAAVIEERLVDRFPRFRRRVADGAPLEGPVWEDCPEFDLRTHVHRRALPAPGGDRALQELVSDLMTEPLDHAKPLWQAYLIEGHRKGCAVFFRMHHCIADGIALARVMLTLTDEAEQPEVVEHTVHATRIDALARPVTATAHAATAAGRLLVHEGIESLLHPSHVAHAAGIATQDARTVTKLLTAPPEAPSPLKTELGVARRVAWGKHLPLAKIKKVGHAHGCTVNDVLMAALTGALRDYLAEVGPVPDEIHAMVPFNLRPLDEPLEAELGNRFGLLLLGLPTGIADPVERLHDMHDRMQAIKDSHEGQIAYGILSIIGLTPGPVETRLIDMFSAKASLVCTNVPGPRHRVSVDGIPVRDVLVWAPTSGSVGVGVTIFSYAGHVITGVMSAESVVPEPARLVRAYEDEVAALFAATV